VTRRVSSATATLREAPMYELSRERVGNAQRTVVLELLSSALEQGYLDLYEYEVRLTRVTESKVVGDLYAQVADLPEQFRWDPQQPLPKSRQEKRQESADTMGLVSLVLGAASIPTSMCFIGGILAVPGVFLSIHALKHGSDRTKARIGLVLSLVGLVMSLALVAAFILSPE
jgi:Domain of unknown function (DUF1707)